jgi:hypothetical protein
VQRYEVRVLKQPASMFGVQLLSSDGDFPPRKKERLLRWVSVHLENGISLVVHIKGIMFLSESKSPYHACTRDEGVVMRLL